MIAVKSKTRFNFDSKYLLGEAKVGFAGTTAG